MYSSTKFKFYIFVLFRFFDITKLYPVNKAEKIPGAIGVLADDIVAGLMTAGIIIFLNIVSISSSHNASQNSNFWVPQ